MTPEQPKKRLILHVTYYEACTPNVLGSSVLYVEPAPGKSIEDLAVDVSNAISRGAADRPESRFTSVVASVTAAHEI